MPDDTKLEWVALRARLLAMRTTLGEADAAALGQVEEMLYAARRCARKLDAAYKRGEVSPSLEYDRLIAWFPAPPPEEGEG